MGFFFQTLAFYYYRLFLIKCKKHLKQVVAGERPHSPSGLIGISPNRKQYDRFSDFYYYLVVIIVCFLLRYKQENTAYHEPDSMYYKETEFFSKTLTLPNYRLFFTNITSCIRLKLT